MRRRVLGLLLAAGVLASVAAVVGELVGRGVELRAQPAALATSSSTTALPTTTTAVPTTTSTSTTTTTVAGGDVWDRLAACESGGRWHIHDSVHEGGLQFAVSTWDAYKPAGFPDGAHEATRDQQIAVAIRVRDGVPGTSDPYLNPQGWAAWPSCSRTIGLR